MPEERESGSGVRCCGDQWDRFWDGVESGSFRSYARGFAVVNLLLMLAVPFLMLITARLLPVLTFVLMISLGVIMALIELPYCCSCCEWCEKLKAVLEVFENFALRGVIYVAFGATLIAVAHRVDKHAVTWAFGIGLPINGVLYWIASCQGEVEVDGASAKKSEAHDVEAGNPPAAAPPVAPVEPQNTMAAAAGVSQEAGATSLEDAAVNLAKEKLKDPKVQKQVAKAALENPGMLREAAKAARM
mmetsp:Transcript_13194/g.27198  ORF Transcript_13194/g.27198 Transcript_13194/m.27198 type:complete len:245 (+) Transcript_13194:83-817(+)